MYYIIIQIATGIISRLRRYRMNSLPMFANDEYCLIHWFQKKYLESNTMKITLSFQSLALTLEILANRRKSFIPSMRLCFYAFAGSSPAVKVLLILSNMGPKS